MHSINVETAIKMLEALPEPAQREVVEQLRDYIADLVDDRAWNERFTTSQPQLMAAARKAKEQIARGEAETLDIEQL